MRYPHWLHLLTCYMVHGTFTWVPWQENCSDLPNRLRKNTMTMNSPWCWIATGRQQTINLTRTDPKSCSSEVPPNIIQPYTKSKKTRSSSRPVQHAKWPTSWWHSILLVVGEYRSLDRLLRILLQLGIIKPLYRTTKHAVKQSLLRNFILPASLITK